MRRLKKNLWFLAAVMWMGGAVLISFNDQIPGLQSLCESSVEEPVRTAVRVPQLTRQDVAEVQNLTDVPRMGSRPPLQIPNELEDVSVLTGPGVRRLPDTFVEADVEHVGHLETQTSRPDKLIWFRGKIEPVK